MLKHQTDGQTAELDDLLGGNATKPFREQLTLIRLFEELRGRAKPIRVRVLG
jgi:hypothetical protein